MSQMNKARQGFSFVEVMIALLVVIACAVPIFYMTTSARTDTSKAINYLRAMEIANEAIEWAHVWPYATLVTITAPVCDSLVEQGGAGIAGKEVQICTPSNKFWSDDKLVIPKVKYPDQYTNAFFFRTIEVTPDPSPAVQAGMMVKVSVTVEWCEGKIPANPVLRGGRTRSLKLETFILYEKSMSY